MKTLFTILSISAALTAAAQSRQPLPPQTTGRTPTPIPAPAPKPTPTPFPTQLPTVFRPAPPKVAPLSYDQLITQGDQYFNNKQFKAAIQHYEQAIAQRPEQYPKDQMLRAQAQQARLDKDAALQKEAYVMSENVRLMQSQFVSRTLVNNNWTNAAVVCDVTGSMTSYYDQLLLWLRKFPEGDSSLPHIVLFNDTDKNSTKGLYSFKPTTYAETKSMVHKAATSGSGGGAEENNIHALLKAQEDCPSAESLVMINDNNIPWDFFMAHLVEKPVHIMVCGDPHILEVAYLNLARMTKGSVHVGDQNYTALESYGEGATLSYKKTVYTVRNGEFVRQ